MNTRIQALTAGALAAIAASVAIPALTGAQASSTRSARVAHSRPGAISGRSASGDRAKAPPRAGRRGHGNRAPLDGRRLPGRHTGRRHALAP